MDDKVHPRHSYVGNPEPEGTLERTVRSGGNRPGAPLPGWVSRVTTGAFLALVSLLLAKAMGLW